MTGLECTTMALQKIGLVLLLAAVATAQNAQSRASTNPNDLFPTTSGITQEQAAKIIQELQMIRMLLEREQQGKKDETAKFKPDNQYATSPLKTIASLGDHTLGRETAPLTLVEFLDLQCPFCMQFQKYIFPELRRKYVDTGRMRIAVLAFPKAGNTLSHRVSGGFPVRRNAPPTATTLTPALLSVRLAISTYELPCMNSVS
jgi:protein-disulfide isomerase